MVASCQLLSQRCFSWQGCTSCLTKVSCGGGGSKFSLEEDSYVVQLGGWLHPLEGPCCSAVCKPKSCNFQVLRVDCWALDGWSRCHRRRWTAANSSVTIQLPGGFHPGSCRLSKPAALAPSCSFQVLPDRLQQVMESGQGGAKCKPLTFAVGPLLSAHVQLSYKFVDREHV